MKMRITIEGKIYEVEVDVLEGAPEGAVPARPAQAAPTPAAAPPAPAAAAPAPAAPAPSSGGAGSFPSPLAGTVRAIKVQPGDSVTANQEIITMEAMKMETAVCSPKDGVIKAINVKEGDVVKSGHPLVEFE